MSAADPTRWMWAEACALIERAEQLHRRFFEPAVATRPQACWEPPLDVFADGRELAVIAALPGVEANDIEIALQADVLMVAGVRRLPALAHSAAIQRLEIPHGRFERRLQLPAGGWTLAQSSILNGCLLLRLTNQY